MGPLNLTDSVKAWHRTNTSRGRGGSAPPPTRQVVPQWGLLLLCCHSPLKQHLHQRNGTDRSHTHSVTLDAPWLPSAKGHTPGQAWWMNFLITKLQRESWFEGRVLGADVKRKPCLSLRGKARSPSSLSKPEESRGTVGPSAWKDQLDGVIQAEPRGQQEREEI